MSNELLKQGFLRNRFFIAAFGITGHALQLFFTTVEVGKNQFKVDDLNIAFWIDRVGNVDHILIFKAAHNVSNGIGFTDIR